MRHSESTPCPRPWRRPQAASTPRRVGEAGGSPADPAEATNAPGGLQARRGRESGRPQSQSKPADGVDGIHEQRARQQRHQQGLESISTEPRPAPVPASPRASRAWNRQASTAVNRRNQGQIPGINAPGTPGQNRPDNQQGTGRQQPQCCHPPRAPTGKQWVPSPSSPFPKAQRAEPSAARGGSVAWQRGKTAFLRSEGLQLRKMIWPWRRKSRRRMARIVVEGPINGATRKRVLKALKEVADREFPALLLRIDSPGGTVGDSQEIHAAILRLREKGCRVVASFGNISASGGVYIGVAAEKSSPTRHNHRFHRGDSSRQRPLAGVRKDRHPLRHRQKRSVQGHSFPRSPAEQPNVPSCRP